MRGAINSPMHMFDQVVAKRLLCDLPKAQLGAELAAMGAPSYRIGQVWEGIYRSLAPDIASLTNLPRDLRAELSNRFVFPGLQAIAQTVSGRGDTQKVLFRLPDGETIESVLMRYQHRRTVCVSSQVGCAIGCPFCATGQAGFRRDLSAGEIVEQALFFARALSPRGERVTHIVLMGMGEPLLNYDNVWQAIETWHDETGFALGARRITLSTAGVVPGIDRLSQERLQIGLSVSLHAADDALRDELVPLNRRYPLRQVLAACRRYVERTSRRVTFEYALIDGLNDAVEQAQSLARLLSGLLCHVNLIPLNPAAAECGRTAAGYAHARSPREQVERFRRVLESCGIPVTVRLGRGADIQAGCGQLRSRQLSIN